MVSTKNKDDLIRDLQEKLEMYQMMFDSIHNGIMVTDAKGYITHFNKTYGQFLNLNPEEQIGKHCLNAVENSRLHIVAQTGKAEINHTHRIKGQNMIVQRIPIKKNGKVIAVFGQVMFKDAKEVGKLARKLSMLESKIELYEQELINLRSTRYTFDSIISQSIAMENIKREAMEATANHFPVLITGESGTGKELFAQAIHHASSRNLYPFVRINCAAIPKDLLESELFGYEKGAFTGAKSTGKPGKIELANRGTLFLDEIGDLPLEMQPKLLRVLEDKEFERIGGTRMLKSDFRLIAATNQNLEALIDEKAFRRDLYYRLNVIQIRIPPLRERRNDIIPIANHLLKLMATDFAFENVQLSPETGEALKAFDWPGNVRELSNTLERAISSLAGDTITPSCLPYYMQQKSGTVSRTSSSDIRKAHADAEINAINAALENAGYNKTRAAKLLGIHRTLLYKKMKKHGIAGSI